MNSSELLSVGVIATSVKQLGELTQLVKGAGFAIAAALQVGGRVRSALPEADVWVVNIDTRDEQAQAMIEQLDHLELPVIYDDDLQADADLVDPKAQPSLTAELRQARERRLASKIRQQVRGVDSSNVEDSGPRARKLWVLAASAGGPEAVIEFLGGVPEDISGVALLYVQHTGEQAIDSLRGVVAKHCRWPVLDTSSTRIIREKQVYVVSPHHQIELLESGVISPVGAPWSGCFHPSIDHVIAKVARVYGSRGGAIVFSGMGDDGAKSCLLLRHRGGQVWVQSAASCAVDSMPRSVERSGCAHFSAHPRQLAKQFALLHQ